MTQAPPKPSGAPGRSEPETRVDYAASAAAPFVSFDDVQAFGIKQSCATIAIVATRFLMPKQDATTGDTVVDPDNVVVAHLRGDLAAWRRLRLAINEVERLFVARQQIVAAETAAGASDATMQ